MQKLSVPASIFWAMTVMKFCAVILVDVGVEVYVRCWQCIFLPRLNGAIILLPRDYRLVQRLVHERLPVGVSDDIAAGHRIGPPGGGKRRGAPAIELRRLGQLQRASRSGNFLRRSAAL